MGAPSLSSMPESFPAGTTVEYTRSLNDYPASQGWTLAVFLAGIGRINATVTVSGNLFAVSFTAALTGSMPSGNYQWQEIASKAGKSYLAADGVVVVTPNISTSVAGDFQSWEEKALVILEAAITGRLSSDMQSFQILGRSVTKIPAKELMAYRDSIASRIQEQKHPGRFGRQVLVRFPGASHE